ncbi:glycosyltransferase family 2 protein [Thalassococcus sp. S3]|uniref:glycosyltransferase family 2 protein n=1 Tax=Thalassococcus sp. S3 TaxID=2017482 RepID=UPI00102B2EFB|nr:glycosyltransferase family 2 protein [Thalassococcus sp. S3]
MTRFSVLPRLRDKMQRLKDDMAFRRALRCRKGHGLTNATPRDVTVIALVRNGAFYLAPFLAHHRALGAAHFIFCDTGSTDDTLNRLMEEPDVTILEARLPIRFESAFRAHAAQTYCRGHWCLYADMDERFTFEGAAQIGLPGLTAYLERQGHTALMAQMLEMFPTGPLSDYAHAPYDTAIAAFDHCDITDVDWVEYEDPQLPMAWFVRRNTVADPGLRFAFGGIRGKVFGEGCCLTKHPLVFVDGLTEPGIHPHCAGHVRCADFSALLQHYKFTNDPFGRDAATVAASGIGHGEDEKRLSRADDALSLFSETAQRYSGLEPLYEAGFLVRSPLYSDFLATQT